MREAGGREDQDQRAEVCNIAGGLAKVAGREMRSSLHMHNR